MVHMFRLIKKNNNVSSEHQILIAMSQYGLFGQKHGYDTLCKYSYILRMHVRTDW